MDSQDDGGILFHSACILHTGLHDCIFQKTCYHTYTCDLDRSVSDHIYFWNESIWLFIKAEALGSNSKKVNLFKYAVSSCIYYLHKL